MNSGIRVILGLRVNEQSYDDPSGCNIPPTHWFMRWAVRSLLLFPWTRAKTWPFSNQERKEKTLIYARMVEVRVKVEKMFTTTCYPRKAYKTVPLDNHRCKDLIGIKICTQCYYHAFFVMKKTKQSKISLHEIGNPLFFTNV